MTIEIEVLNKTFEVEEDEPTMFDHTEYPFTLKVQYEPSNILKQYYSWQLLGAGQEKPLAEQYNQTEREFNEGIEGPSWAYQDACKTLRSHIRVIDDFDSYMDQE